MLDLKQFYLIDSICISGMYLDQLPLVEIHELKNPIYVSWQSGKTTEEIEKKISRESKLNPGLVGYILNKETTA